jgi:hypothetical protein
VYAVFARSHSNLLLEETIEIRNVVESARITDFRYEIVCLEHQIDDMVQTIVVEEIQESLSGLALEEAADAFRRHLDKLSYIIQSYPLHIILMHITDDLGYTLAVSFNIDTLVANRCDQGIIF